MTRRSSLDSRQPGAIELGKLNLHEFAAGGTSENPHYGAVHNPWNLEHNPGGSSGGSGAALAAGMCLGATGSDTAGSIRIPSHACGTTGIKPTYGRVSCFGVIPLSWSLDHVGPMTRSATDAAVMLDVLAGFDRRDSATVERGVDDYTAGLDLGVRGLHIGVPSSYFNESLQPEVESAWRAAVDTLIQLGADTRRRRVRDVERRPANWHDHRSRRDGDVPPRLVRTAAGGLQSRGTRALCGGPLGRRPGVRSAPSGTVNRFAQSCGATFDQVDVLLTPTMPTTMARIGSSMVEFDARSYDTGQLSTRCTYPFNLCGFPAMSVPCGFDRQGLPIGLQLAAAPWQEALLLRVANQYQQVTDWHRRRPPTPAPSSPAA